MSSTTRWLIVRRLVRTALITLGVVGAVYYFWLWLPRGTGPAGPQVPKEAFAKTWTDRNVVLLGIGDSVTAGFGADREHSYFSRLARNPADEWPEMRGVCLASVLPNLKTQNLAVSGSISLEHAARQVNRLPLQATNVLGLVVMTTGGNDIIHDYGRTPPREGAMFGATWEQAQPWIASFEGRLDKMIQQIAGSFPGGCHIFLANIYDPTDGTGGARLVGLPGWPDGLKIHTAYNEVIARVAARHPDTVHLVDIHSAFLGHGLSCRQLWRRHYRASDAHYWYFDILEDPNDRGHDALRRLFLIEITRVMTSKFTSAP